jgi:hypothetical protein
MRTTVDQTTGDRSRLRRRRLRIALIATAGVVLAAAGSAAAFQALPLGTQVNDDPGSGIDPTLPVSTEDPANADVVGGSLVAAKPLVPWAIFRQTESSSKDQVFSRSFAKGAWTTRGTGTVGGSSASPIKFSGSLNFDQGQDGEAPSIDFAGTNRTVPWASWYEHTTGTNFGPSGADNIFASKFDNLGDANQNKWIFAGQGRGNGGAQSVPVPSLNIHTNRDAVNPVVQGGATVAVNPPVPWVTWQEIDGSATGPQEIFVSKAVKPTSGTTCPDDGANPIKPPATTGAEGGLCFQQVGVERVTSGAGSIPASTTDPSLNVDPTRDGIEPDMAFTGAGDTVPWVVWYEVSNSSPNPHPSGIGLRNNEMVFAAKATPPSPTTPPTGAVDGGFNWTAVGRTGIPGSGVLDQSSTNNFGPCAQNQDTEASCSLNADPTKDAEDPRVAAGTMTAGNPTVPWVVWDEGNGAPNNNGIFVARLVGTGGTARFVLANSGLPIGTGDRADITFSGHTPYVSWHHNGSIVTGHFTTPDSFVKDNAPIGSSAPDSVRAPISSGCIANPFSSDGSACQAGALGTPFFLFTDSAFKLFADAYQPDAVTTGPASAITTSSATISGSVNPEGAPALVSFQFGTNTAYGGTTTAIKTGPDDSPDSFSASLTGLAPGTTIHYRAVATSDFGTFVGADQHFTTTGGTPPPPGAGTASAGHAKVKGTSLKVPASCTGASGATCRLAFKLTVVEHLRGHKVLKVTANARQRKVTVTVGSAHTTVAAGAARTVSLSLNGKGKRLLTRFRHLTATLKVTQTLADGSTRSVSSQKVTFRARKHHK